MRRIVFICCSFLLITQAFTQTEEYYFRLPIHELSEVDLLSRQFSIDKLDNGFVYGYANDMQWKKLRTMDYAIERLPHPGALYDHKLSEEPEEIQGDWDTYPTYGAYANMMVQYADSFSHICRLDTFGYSTQGRLLLVMKITDQPALEEDEPEFFYTSTMHGDETVGYVLMLRLIDYLLHQYNQPTPEGERVGRLVNNMEIWINPLANPDGTYRAGNHTVTGAWRYNPNGVDLNRDFPDRIHDPNNTGQGREIETQAMMQLVAAQNFNLSANFHGGAEVVNYPWDNGAPSGVYSACPDDAWFIDICQRYASLNPDILNGGFPNGITNGCRWYAINGGRQDWIYWWYGSRETTIELWDIKNPPGSILPGRWNNNKESFLTYMEETFKGIRGIVRDAVTGEPLAAQIDIFGFPSVSVFTDSLVGDYHRLLLPGAYDMVVSADGYNSDTLVNVAVFDSGATRHNFLLQPANFQLFSKTMELQVASYSGSVEWGDYDRDTDLDLLTIGADTTEVLSVNSAIFRNDGDSIFTEVNTGLSDVWHGAGRWGDFDNDNYLDVLLTGAFPDDGTVSAIYRQQSGTFTDINANITPMGHSCAAWADYDNDGDLDFVIIGNSGLASIPYTKIYRNDEGSFTDIQANPEPIRSSGSVAWADFDNDSDLDLLLTGVNGASEPVSKIYRNDLSVAGQDTAFVEINANLQNLSRGFGEWGDYDNDGYSDILFGGRDSTGAATTLVYRNEGNGNFTEVQAGLIGLTSGAGAWGDYDNDGDLDIAITGAQNISPPYHPVTKLYRNDGNDRFMPVMIPLTGLRESSLAWGDFNNDQRLDLIVSGLDSNDHLKTHIYRNNFGSFNTRPLSPQGLTASVAGDTVHLSWNAATDNETPSPALTYNLRMGTTPGGTDIISPMADPSTGYRYQVAQGNAHHDTVWYIYNLSSGTYYWSVQAIDQSFAGSEFATENSFVVNNTGIPNNKDPVPQKFALLQNYPNPFNPQTRIQFTLPKATEINLTIYNMLGQPVRTLAKGRRSAGIHEILWDGNNTRGDPAPSGIYMYRLKTKREVQTRKMLLVR